MLSIEVVTPEKVIYKNDKVKKVVFPFKSGQYEVLPKHSPYLAELDSGIAIVYLEDETKDILALHSGFVQILDNKIKVVAFIAETKDQIDKMRALDSLNRAKERLNNPEKFDIERVKNSLKRAETRLKAVDYEA